jgi:hypothetical protein
MRDLGDLGSSNEVLTEALRACEFERFRDQTHNIRAYLCVGEANLTEAVPNHDARKGYCAFLSAALLARRAGRGSASLQSQAHIGRARALRVIGSPDEVIYAYRSAIAAQGTPEASVALARYYVERSEFGRARELLIHRDGRTPLVTGAGAAIAIVELARAQYPEQNSTEYRSLINIAESAVSAAPGRPTGNVGVDSALGVAYFDTNPSLARDYLWSATQGAVPVSRIERELQLEAFYHRSIIEAQQGNYEQARLHADQAGNSIPAMRQQCLVRLVMAGQQAYRDEVYRLETHPRTGRPISINPSIDGQRACERLSAAPEGPLLEGMFWLRYSQFRAAYFNPQADETYASMWRDAVNRAEAAFARGKDRVGDDVRTPLGWPGAETIAPPTAPGQGSIKLRDVYGYADDLGNFFGSYCQTPMNLRPEEARIERLFVHYRIVRASGAYRCGPPEM